MGIQNRWHAENDAVLYTTFADPWTIDDYYAMIAEVKTLLARHDGIYFHVLDFTGTQQLPPNFLSALRAADSHQNPNLELAIVIGANRFIQIIGTMAQRLGIKAASNIHFADSLADALAMAARQQKE